jgi:hypothetical protein
MSPRQSFQRPTAQSLLWSLPIYSSLAVNPTSFSCRTTHLGRLEWTLHLVYVSVFFVVVFNPAVHVHLSMRHCHRTGYVQPLAGSGGKRGSKKCAFSDLMGVLSGDDVVFKTV